jgi:hypothetical protein
LKNPLQAVAAFTATLAIINDRRRLTFLLTGSFSSARRDWPEENLLCSKSVLIAFDDPARTTMLAQAQSWVFPTIS